MLFLYLSLRNCIRGGTTFFICKPHILFDQFWQEMSSVHLLKTQQILTAQENLFYVFIIYLFPVITI